MGGRAAVVLGVRAHLRELACWVLGGLERGRCGWKLSDSRGLSAARISMVTNLLVHDFTLMLVEMLGCCHLKYQSFGESLENST